MYTILVILICIASALMIAIVLIQESKGGGLASSFSSYNQIGGVRKTTNFIEKATCKIGTGSKFSKTRSRYLFSRSGH